MYFSFLGPHATNYSLHGTKHRLNSEQALKIKHVIWWLKFKSHFNVVKKRLKTYSRGHFRSERCLCNMRGSREGARGSDPLKNHKAIGFHSNTGLDPLRKHKATKQAFNVVPSSARYLNFILMEFHWRFDNGSF